MSGETVTGPAASSEDARRLGPGHRVVTVQVDSGLKYLAGQLYS
jgi:hypothetical protein